MKSAPSGGGLLSRLLTAAIVLLLAAYAINEAVRLLVGVWRPLLVIGVAALCVAGLAAWWRRRSRSW